MEGKIEPGDRFTKLVVMNRVPRPDGVMNRSAYWICRCDCGNETIVSSNSLSNGYTKSCGCYHAEVIRTHGLINTPEYNSWVGMRTRCYNVNDKAYSVYGARGITVCDRWNPAAGGSFENFLEDMGEKPQAIDIVTHKPMRFSVERKNNNGNYEKSNCKWATDWEQAANRTFGRPVKKRRYERKLESPGHVKDLSGHTYGAWTVLRMMARVEGSNRPVYWLCRCVCGNYGILKSAYLRNESRPNRSCGCMFYKKTE